MCIFKQNESYTAYNGFVNLWVAMWFFVPPEITLQKFDKMNQPLLEIFDSKGYAIKRDNGAVIS